MVNMTLSVDIPFEEGPAFLDGIRFEREGDQITIHVMNKKGYSYASLLPMGLTEFNNMADTLLKPGS